jgi:DNA invertase Pin-like site-specific DNA recombinase
MTAARKSGKRVGYIRVSSVDQNESRQLDGLELDRVFTDKASGKDTKRPQLLAAIDFLREGDVLVVHSMDRLARNLDDLRRIVSELTAKEVTVEFQKEGLTFTSEDNAMSKLLLSVMGAFAEFERSIIHERQKEGIAVAKRNGVYKGRRPSLTPERVADLRKAVNGGLPIAKAARAFGVSRQTVYTHCPKIPLSYVHAI